MLLGIVCKTNYWSVRDMWMDNEPLCFFWNADHPVESTAICLSTFNYVPYILRATFHCHMGCSKSSTERPSTCLNGAARKRGRAQVITQDAVWASLNEQNWQLTDQSIQKQYQNPSSRTLAAPAFVRPARMCSISNRNGPSKPAIRHRN